MGKNVCVGWSAADDLKLLEAIRVHGTSWLKVATEFRGRSHASLRNRYARLRCKTPRRRYHSRNTSEKPPASPPVAAEPPARRAVSYEHSFLDGLIDLNHNDVESIASDFDVEWLDCFA